jgi:predicted enzyme related to lactoylglutathione lyase
MNEIEFIIYVSNQNRSKEFYSKLLNLEPYLDVDGMTEFKLNEFCKFGIMPEIGIAKILSDKMLNPSDGNGIPRCELYLKVENAIEYLKRGIKAGAKEVSPFQIRDWGDNVGYLSDFDGHIIAIAEKILM